MQKTQEFNLESLPKDILHKIMKEYLSFNDNRNILFSKNKRLVGHSLSVIKESAIQLLEESGWIVMKGKTAKERADLLPLLFPLYTYFNKYDLFHIIYPDLENKNKKPLIYKFSSLYKTFKAYEKSNKYLKENIDFLNGKSFCKFLCEKDDELHGLKSVAKKGHPLALFFVAKYYDYKSKVLRNIHVGWGTSFSDDPKRGSVHSYLGLAFENLKKLNTTTELQKDKESLQKYVCEASIYENNINLQKLLIANPQDTLFLINKLSVSKCLKLLNKLIEKGAFVEDESFLIIRCASELVKYLGYSNVKKISKEDFVKEMNNLKEKTKSDEIIDSIPSNKKCNIM